MTTDERPCSDASKDGAVRMLDALCSIPIEDRLDALALCARAACATDWMRTRPTDIASLATNPRVEAAASAIRKVAVDKMGRTLDNAQRSTVAWLSHELAVAALGAEVSQ